MQEKNTTNATFAQRLTAAMSHKGLNQKELCVKTKIQKSSMSRYCSGEMLPGKKSLALLSAALGVSSAWLLGEETAMGENEIHEIEKSQLLEIESLNKENDNLRKENQQLKQLLESSNAAIEAVALRGKMQSAREEVETLNSTIEKIVKNLQQILHPQTEEQTEKGEKGKTIRLYHYTSYENMMKIVSTLKMKAFEPGRSNDPLESRVHIALPRGAQKTLIEKRDEVLSLWRKSGFCAVSFSTSCSSVPMWERYADKYKGCVLAFRFPIQSDGLVTNLENANLLPIKYDKQLPTMGDFTPETKNSIKNELIWKGLLHKGKDWEHEREIRLILNVAEIENDGSNLFFSLPASCLEGIILGPRCEGSPVVLYNFLKNRGLNIEVTEARASAEMAEIIDGTWEDWEDEEYERFCREVPSLFLAKQNMN